MVAERIRALGALRSVKSKKTLAAQKQRETHILSNEVKLKWIEQTVEADRDLSDKYTMSTKLGVAEE